MTFEEFAQHAETFARGGLALTFATTTFFEVFDVKQVFAHEFKASWLGSGGSVPGWDALPLRVALGDPFDPERLLMSPGISTLTIRRDRSGMHRFVLHERDGGKVADGGGLCHVMPAGEFQPSSADPADVHNDFCLWRNIMREFSEEFLGNPEHDGSDSRSIDYAEEEPFRMFERARDEGGFRVWHYGLVLEPLELGAVQLTVAVVDDEVFDRLFADLVMTNDEGRVAGGYGRTDMPFTGEAIDRLNPRLSARYRWSRPRTHPRALRGDRPTPLPAEAGTCDGDGARPRRLHHPPGPVDPAAARVRRTPPGRCTDSSGRRDEHMAAPGSRGGSPGTVHRALDRPGRPRSALRG